MIHYDTKLMDVFYKTELHTFAELNEQLTHCRNPLDKLVIMLKIKKISETIEEIENFYNTYKIK